MKSENTVRKLPVGIQDFEKIIKSGNLYIDKTEYIYRLVHTEVPYFLSRPRRFGKSLLLSTLKAYWEGKKDLFNGLKIEKLEKNNPDAWIKYPVFYLDLNRDEYSSSKSLDGVLNSHLERWEKTYNVVPSERQSLAVRFQNVLRAASESTQLPCVVLVDEYDKPLLESSENRELSEHNKAMFKGFFSALKSEDAIIRFIFIAGVTKFSKVSIFSDLNQLEDISFDDDYSGICGITEKELTEYLEPEIESMSTENNSDVNECKRKLKSTYDGYRFSARGVGVYNPYSLLTALKKRRFGSFWYETGTPTFLVHRLKEIDFDVRRFEDKTIQSVESILSDYRVENPDPVPLLYQTGYLTIKECSEESILTLGFPNEEVRYAFLQSLMPEYVNEYGTSTNKDIFTLKRYAEEGNTEGIKNVLTALFGSISYTTQEVPFEHYFQTVIYITFTLLRQYALCELHTSEGRIDCVVETKRFVYIFEFKRDKSSEEALKQIHENNYAVPYAADERRVYKIGVNFSSKTRQLEGWIVE